jgi:hypothetical protein
MGACSSKEQTAQATAGSTSKATPKSTATKADSKETMVSVQGWGSNTYCAIFLIYMVMSEECRFFHRREHTCSNDRTETSAASTFLHFVVGCFYLFLTIRTRIYEAVMESMDIDYTYAASVKERCRFCSDIDFWLPNIFSVH